MPTPAPSVATSPPPPSDVFQHYQVLRRPDDGSLWELGRGAMGITYKAFDVNLRCHVALKVVNSQFLHSETARARFVREARAAARLRHPNVASVYHLGTEGDTFFYAMEFIDGETLEALVRRLGPLAPATALRLVSQVARALIAASRQRLVHRDIKPANLMVVRDDDDSGEDAYAELRVKVIDFGLARSLFAATHVDGSVANAADPSALSNVTVAGFVGTPLFASPEQLEEKDLDARSDFYSLGVTLWYLLAGQPPFTGTLASIISQHLTRQPPLENLPASVPAPVRELLARLLQKDAAKRPQTAVELRNELEAVLRALFAARAASVVANEAAETLPEGDALFAVAAADLPATGASARRGGDADAANFATGTILAGRYRLVRFVGEGSGGRLFLARDLNKDRMPVAVRVLPADLVVTPQEEDALRADCDRARNAPHPALLGALACERHGLHFYLVREWVNGFTLVELLRNRGTLGIEDVLRLLQPAAFGMDHAADAGLARRLDLAPHQVLLHFLGDRVNDGADAPLRAVPDGPLAGWPQWQLKLDPLSLSRESSDLVTWAGDLTLLPENDSAVAAPATTTTVADGQHRLAALGRLIYELLGGVMTTSGPARFVNRPTLGEEANAVLGRCVLAASDADAGFASCVEFYETLARASGFDPATLEPFVAPPPARASVAALSIPVPAIAEEEQENTRAASDTLLSSRAVSGSNPAQKKSPSVARRPRHVLDADEEVNDDRFAPSSSSSEASQRQRSDDSAMASAWQRALLLTGGSDDGGSFLLRWPVVMAASVILLGCAIAFAVVVQRRQARVVPTPAPVVAASPARQQTTPQSALVSAASPTPAPAASARPTAKPTPSALAAASRPAPSASSSATPTAHASPTRLAQQPTPPPIQPSPAPSRPSRVSSNAAPTPAPTLADPRALAAEIAASSPENPAPRSSLPPDADLTSRTLITAESAPTPPATGRSVDVSPLEPPPAPSPENLAAFAPTPPTLATPPPLAAASPSPGSASDTADASSTPTPRAEVVAAPSPTPRPRASVMPSPTPALVAAARPTPTPAVPVAEPRSPQERRVTIRLSSEPTGAEVTLRGESLGVTPKIVTLPPGDYTLVGHYWNWQEVARSIHLSPEDIAVDVKIRMMPPEQNPLNRPAPTPIARQPNRERTRRASPVTDSSSSPPTVAAATPASGGTDVVAASPTPTPRNWNPLRLFNRNRQRENSQSAAPPPTPAPPAPTPVLVTPDGRPEPQPFFDGREPVPAPTEERPRGQQ